MKDTAIDYLYQQFVMLHMEYVEGKIDYYNFCELMELAKNAAKNIEQVQIEQAYNNGLVELTPMHHKDGQGYYNEKYKQ
jgi:hypothetical protein